MKRKKASTLFTKKKKKKTQEEHESPSFTIWNFTFYQVKIIFKSWSLSQITHMHSRTSQRRGLISLGKKKKMKKWKEQYRTLQKSLATFFCSFDFRLLSLTIPYSREPRSTGDPVKSRITKRKPSLKLRPEQWSTFSYGSQVVEKLRFEKKTDEFLPQLAVWTNTESLQWN